MYRLLIVDDEEFITNSLAFMLESVPQFELDVYKAYSGYQALEYLNKFSFDIVVTDVQMPGMTGIDLAGRIHDQWPSCQIVFLTCYDEFEYAYKAIEYHAVRYVLKNEGDEVLLSAISKCIDIIDREAHNSEALLKAEEQLRTYMPIMRQSLLQSCLMEASSSLEEMERQFERLEISLKPALPVMMLAAHVSPLLNGDTISYIDLVLNQKVGHVVNCQISWTDANCIMWIVQPKEANYEQARVTIKGMAESIQRVCSGSLDLKISFVFDSAVTGWDRLPGRFPALKDTVGQRLEKYPDIAIAGIEFFLEEMERADDSNSNNEMQEQLKTNDSFISHLLQYIKDNMDADLSLYALSEKVYLNPSYLSRRFKEITGKNITETIVEIRMAEACRLLEETTYKINRIADMVGYESAAYFSRLFKKQIGMTPQKYRENKVSPTVLYNM